ncbi:MAG: hypothetical protein PHI63_00955 [Patescibacteria group bacterium]|nr:hypothetical protein [Patescibacteria group bacterium]
MVEANDLRPIVCKFDGTATANADRLRRVRDIVRSDPLRRFVVVSAFGKYTHSDHDCTSLLMLCDAHVRLGYRFDPFFKPIAERFRTIVRDLQLEVDIQRLLDEVEAGIMTQAEGNKCYAASRGEYLMAVVVANFLGWPFIDATEVIRFSADGALDSAATNAAIAERLSQVEHAVLPGFYGSLPDGRLKTFPRGGSNITGALVAGSVHAARYECWTDAAGLVCPAPGAEPVGRMTYAAFKALPEGGVKIFPAEALAVVQETGLLLNLRDTDRPEHPGTLIVPDHRALQ